MSEFGTGLREHLRGAHSVPEPDEPAAAVDSRLEDVRAERLRLEAVAAELAGKELELAEREAQLQVTQERMALTLARALLQAANEMDVPPPLDELAVARARRLAIK
jgi:hypothetical protein